MKVAQNDETNPDTQPVRPPHTSNISNTQLSPSGSPVRKRETQGILSRMFPPFASITYYRIRAHLAPLLDMSCIVMLMFALYSLFLPPSSSPVDPEIGADATKYNYIDDEPFSCQSNQASPPLITRYRLFFSLLLALE